MRVYNPYCELRPSPSRFAFRKQRYVERGIVSQHRVQFGVMSLPMSSAACHPQRTLSAWYELKTFAHADIVDDACRQGNSVYRAVRIFIDNAERLSGTGDAWPRRRSGPRPRRRSGSGSGRWSGRCSRTRSCGGGWGRCWCGS